MGILLQPGHVFLCPFRAGPYHQFEGSPEGCWELLCRKATPVQIEELSGLAQDVFNLHQDQTLLIDPTLCGLKERQEVPVDRGKTNFRCGCLGHWAPPAKQRDDSSVLSNAVMRNGSARDRKSTRL